MASNSADRTLRATQKNEREAASKGRRRVAALDLVRVLLDAREDILGEDGQLRETGVRAPLRRLQRDVAVALPALSGCGLEKRLRRLMDLLPVDLATVELLHQEVAERVLVSSRLAHDRLEYLDWVVASLQDLAGGRPVPEEAPAPADLADASAEPWIAPQIAVPPASAPRQRRWLIARQSPPQQTR